MTNEQLHQLHDDVIPFFGLNKGRLKGFLMHLATSANYQSQDKYMCVFPVEASDPMERRLELAIINAHMNGIIRSGIYFSSRSKAKAIAPCLKINKELWGTTAEEVNRIIETNQSNRQKKESELFNKALLKIVSCMAPEQILSTPGVYESISEEFNNTAMDVVEKYSADPGINNLDIKYTTKEILEIAISELQTMKEMLEAKPLEDPEKNQVKQVEQTIKLANAHLESMKSLLENMVM